MQTHTIKLFGPLKEVIGSTHIEMNGITSIDQLRTNLSESFPQLKTFIYSVAVNQVIQNENQLIEMDDEIALLPPFAGG